MERKNRSPIWRMPRDQFKELWNSCKTMKEFLGYWNLENKGNNNQTARKRARQEGLDMEKFLIANNIALAARAKLKTEWTPEKIFECKERLCRKFLLRALESIGREYVCESCGQGPEWNGKPLTIQIDHTDGNGQNNSPSNLRYLCPNCHTQTNTFCGRANKKYREPTTSEIDPNWRRRPQMSMRKVERPSKEDLLKLLETENYCSVGRMYGVTDNAIRKWVKHYEDYSPQV